MRVFCTLEGERHPKHTVHRGVHLRVHLGDSSNSRKENHLNARRGEIWAHAKHRSGLERPPFFSACAPKKAFGVVPAHWLSPKVRIMHSLAISIPKMPTAPKLVSPRHPPLDPELKSWIDNVIVPAMVREFLEQSESYGSKVATSVVQSFDSRAFSREGHK